MDNQALSGTEQKERTPAIKSGWLRCLIFIIALGLLVLVQSLIIVLATGITSEAEFAGISNKPVGIFVQIFMLGSAVVLIWLFRRFVDNRSFISLGFSLKGDKIRDLFVGILWGAGLILVVFGVLYISGSVTIAEVGLPVASLVFLLLFLTMASAYEEIILRGYILNNLMQSMNKYLALILVSVLFAALHGFNPNVDLIGLLNIILAGLLLGIYYLHRQNLWLPITLHSAWNFFQGPVLGSAVSGTKSPSILTLETSGHKLLTGGEFGFESSVVTSVLLILATLALHVIYRRSQRQQQDSPDNRT